MMAAQALLLSALLFGGCKDSPTDTNNGTPQQITEQYYIQASIDGSYQTAQGASGGSSSGVGLHCNGSYGHGTKPGYQVVELYDFQRIVLNGFTPTLDTSYRSIQIVLIKNFPEQPYGEELYGLVSNPLSYGSQQNQIDGVEIRWIDASGKEWRSSWGSGDQSGSSFSFTSNDKITYLPGMMMGGMYNSKGTFNCKLYDNAGNSMMVTEGTFSLQTVFDH